MENNPLTGPYDPSKLNNNANGVNPHAEFNLLLP